MSIISLKYCKHPDRKYQWLSLLRCDNCGWERTTPKCHAVNGLGVKYCRHCKLKLFPSRRKHTLDSYIELGNQNSLLFLEKDIPKNNHTRCKWQCNICKSIFIRSWHDLNDCKYTCSDHLRLEKCNWILHPKFKNKEEKHIRKKTVSIIYSLINRTLKYKGNKSYLDILGYSFEELKNYIESLWEPWMNWDNYGKFNKQKRTWQIDHIKSIAEYFNEGITNAKIINALSNLQPLDSKINISKNSVKIIKK